MINVKELRIGNAVTHNGRPIIVKDVSEMGINYEWNVKGGTHIYNEDIDPISITGEMLSMHGFIYDQLTNTWNLNYVVTGGFEITKDDNTKLFHLSFNGNEHSAFVAIKYFHHLQNILFDYAQVELPYVVRS